MDKNKQILFYFTAHYPFGNGEQFIENEILEISKHYYEIYLFPYDNLDGTPRKKLPDNVKIITGIKKESDNGKKLLLTNSFLTFGIIALDFFQKNGINALKTINLRLKEISNGIFISQQINKIKNEFNHHKIHFYSTWMNEWALPLSILFHQKTISNFSFKMRGYDLFDERRPYNYMPFRNFIFKNSSCKITMSEEGKKYLNAKGYKNIFANYPGIDFNRIIAIKSEPHFLLVSCSNMIPLKRVDLIAASLKFVSVDLKWIHFGDGPEMGKVTTLVQQLPNHITVELKGSVPNTEVISFYEKNYVDAFIHLSLSEGFGFAVAEAFSFGIPAILFPGGAIQELIDENYCITINSEDNVKTIGEKINSFLLKNQSNSKLREIIIEQNKEKFDIKKCVQNLANLIAQK